jgi:hypothetical protein
MYDVSYHYRNFIHLKMTKQILLLPILCFILGCSQASETKVTTVGETDVNKTQNEIGIVAIEKESGQELQTNKIPQASKNSATNAIVAAQPSEPIKTVEKKKSNTTIKSTLIPHLIETPIKPLIQNP